MLYVGRVAVEKNIEAFLGLDLPGTKVVVGDGPQLEELQRRYPDVHFFGAADTARSWRATTPRRRVRLPEPHRHFRPGDARGLASGLPVAGYPVPGPLDVVPPGVGASTDLRKACYEALKGVREKDARAYGETYSWRACAEQFLATLRPIPRGVWQPLRRRVLPDAAAS